MQVKAFLDVDVIAVEQDDKVAVLLEVAAPAMDSAEPRPPATVEVVLDRSGSMAGDRLEAAKAALTRLVDRLDPGDRLGVVAFDDQVHVVVPAGAIVDKPAAKAAIDAVHDGGSTNLSGGVLRGIQEARRVAGPAGATLILLSDGHANVGETDPDRLGAVAAGAREHGITTTTVGIGLGYDEQLLSAMARGGQGNHVFAESGDEAAAAVAGEVDGLLSKTVQAATLVVKPSAPVDSVVVWNDLPSHAIDRGVMVEVGDFWSGEQRQLMLTFDVPAKSVLGLTQIADLELRYVALPELVEQMIAIPLHIGVVPGDQAAGRIPDARVRSELVIQQVQAAKRRASEELRAGDRAAAAGTYRAAGARLRAASLLCPSPALADERATIETLDERAAAGDVEWAAKFGLMDHARKSRRSGRRV